MGRPYTQDELDCIADVKSILKTGDRVRLTACPGTARTITFHGFDGKWMVSRSGRNDYSPLHIISINKVPYFHKGLHP